MTNTNALEGIRCPQCGSTEEFTVQALTLATVVDNGVSDTRNTTWEDDATTNCNACGHEAAWSEFVAPAAITPPAEFKRVVGVTQDMFAPLATVELNYPHSSCVNCGRTIWWNGHRWFDQDTNQAPLDVNRVWRYECVRGGNHQPLWLTLGEFRDRTKHLPDDLPVTATPEGNEGPEWVNLQLVDVPKGEPDDQPSLILYATDNFDTRQW